MSLRDYARKRRFDKTPEPGAGASGKVSHRPIFVIQLHHARARHYDFRLEMDGTLKSWAVPKGPSLRVGEKRLAVEVEDHPLEYAAFEGDIPEGNYGAGHVDIFDHGHWACEGDPLEALAAGKIDFTLSGEKLEGGWKLVRTAMKGRQRQWLLIKRDDDFVKDRDADDLLTNGKPRKSPRAAKRSAPAVKTGARAGSAGATKAGTWRKRALALDGAKDGGMPVGFAPQLTTLRVAPPEGDDWLHEIKWDGYRLMVDLVGGKAKLRSRGGLDWNETFPEVARAVESLPVKDACLDGELIVLASDGRSDFSELQAVIGGTSKAQLRYAVFDMPGVAGVDLRRVKLIERKALLQQLIGKKAGLISFSDHVIGHGSEVFAASAKQKIEGIVSKNIDAGYRSGRSADWIKAKHEETDEFIIVGYTEPKGSRTSFGSLLMATRDRGGLRYVGRVGTGFDDARLRSIHRQLEAITVKSPAVELPGHIPFPKSNVRWVKPSLVAEVAFRGWAKEGLLRQASFKRMREDKKVSEVGVQETADMSITHPERVVFEGSKITKGDVAEYYRAVARWLLPEVAGRPLSLLRCPDGTKGQCFFQKHHSEALGPNVHAVSLKQKSGKEDYLYIDSVEGLIELVQMNVLEFHPWGSTVKTPERPDSMVFDLDPGDGVRWPAIVAAARDIRAQLKRAGLESFVRLSGGKGLHVVVPIAPGPSWDEVKDFCEAFASALAEYQPDTYVATMSKAKRPGKIFIDWLRNGRGSTSVASWSLRARKGAPVAVPLRWEDLAKIRKPDEFDIAKASQRTARLRKDPWEGMSGIRQKLPKLG